MVSNGVEIYRVKDNGDMEFIGSVQKGVLVPDLPDDFVVVESVGFYTYCDN